MKDITELRFVIRDGMRILQYRQNYAPEPGYEAVTFTEILCPEWVDVPCPAIWGE